MVKIFIVDDHTIFTEGIYLLLQTEEDIELVGYSTNATNCLEYLEHHKVDVLLMDISLPDMSGVDLCRIIKQRRPGVMVLALSTLSQGAYIRKIMEAGGSGYLVKDTSRQELLNAIKLVNKGKIYLSQEASHALKMDSLQQSALPSLTRREKEVLVFIADGLTNAQIAEKLSISIDTVDSHRKNLHSKLNVKNTATLVRYAVENNLL